MKLRCDLWRTNRECSYLSEQKDSENCPLGRQRSRPNLALVPGACLQSRISRSKRENDSIAMVLSRHNWRPMSIPAVLRECSIDK
uniref:Uncharacterized protein n=1 Tax=Plectus sambesii TaxID=2011161 RepID=A0A914WBG1_9BILA